MPRLGRATPHGYSIKYSFVGNPVHCTAFGGVADCHGDANNALFRFLISAVCCSIKTIFFVDAHITSDICRGCP